MQGLQPPAKFRISRVGVRGVRKPVQVERDGLSRILIANIDVAVDLPSFKKGADMSRYLEVIGEVVEESVESPCRGVEHLAATVAQKLLETHPYATRAYVDVHSTLFLRREWGGRTSLEGYEILGRAVGLRGDGIRKFVGVRVTGMTACPCAMETVRSLLINRYPDMKGFLDSIPVPTHNQRNVVSILVEIPEGCDVDAERLIAIAEASLSAPTFEILKRRPEGELVLMAHENPKFVEDVVRDALKMLLKELETFPDSTEITVVSESMESIHQHNAYAERTTTLGELRR